MFAARETRKDRRSRRESREQSIWMNWQRSFDVSHPTMRKDLTSLEQQGLLKRTHGGAAQHSCAGGAGSHDAVRSKRRGQARAVGLACCDLVEDGEAIFLDCGTTMHHFAQQLATRGLQLTVLTNSPSIGECLADVGGITHIVLGGQMRRKSGGISGPLALEIVNQFSIATAFIGAQRDHRRGDHRGGL